jgi:outer membrane protein OmpA-like peptidoglycan-associated protein
MADAPTTRLAPEPPEEPSANGTPPFEELRHLILAPEQEALERLHERVTNPETRTEDVSSVVAEAIQRRRQQGGDTALSEALAPTIETALRESVRKDPGSLADALFPVMGPAIRRSILETLRSFLDSFNQIMDQSLSWQGMKWRMEALRTGRTFTEVVLLHSLVFRVEQVFLIHKKTGLPIGHVVAPAVAMQDPSLVSGMLSAIQDFVRDSFHTSQAQGIKRMNVGDLDVWVEEGPYAILAVVIRGIAPRQLRDNMAETLENIHRQYSAQLDRFDGDSAPFAQVNALLSRCLEYKYKEEPKPANNLYALAAAALLVLAIGGWFGYRAWQDHRWNAYVADLSEQPGYAVTSFGREHGTFVIRGLRDPLAADPGELLKKHNLTTQPEFHWGAYYALDDSLVQQRATQILAPPPETSLRVKDGVLSFTGQPPFTWLKELPRRALQVPGIRSVDTAGLLSAAQHAVGQSVEKIQSTVIKFPLASPALSPAESARLRALLPELKELEGVGNMTIEVWGHSDTSGAEATNLTLSQKRADRVASELIQLGIPANLLRVKGVAAADPLRPEDSEENRAFNRSVSFRPIVHNLL